MFFHPNEGDREVSLLQSELLSGFLLPPLLSTLPSLLPQPSTPSPNLILWGALGQPTTPLGVPRPAWQHVGLSKSMWDVCLDR